MVGASAGAPTEALPAARQGHARAAPPDPLGTSPEAPWTPPSAVLQLITGGRASAGFKLDVDTEPERAVSTRTIDGLIYVWNRSFGKP